MEHSAFPGVPPTTRHGTTHVRLQPLNSTAVHQSPFRGPGNPDGLPPPHASGIDNIGTPALFHASEFNSFPDSYTGPPSGSATSATIPPHALDETKPVPVPEYQHNEHNTSGGRFGLPGQTHAHRGPSRSTVIGTALPPLTQFGTLPQRAATNPAVAEVPKDRRTNLAKTDSINGTDSPRLARDGQLPTNIVENPPDLHIWRQKLFDLESPIILTNEEYDMYFPWVDNVYSHRTSQTASKRGLVTRYFDCRLKGRPSGTPKSQDPNKKKRKRTARPLDLCDVRIKITEYPAGSAGEIMTVGHAIGLDSELVESAVWRIQDGPFRVIQRNGTIGNGDDRLATHRHDLQKSDETKKSTALRYLAGREREVKRTQKPSPWKPRGNAAATAKDHSGDADIKFYSACFCPFSQRVWIALEAMGFKYQYCETDPLRKPKPTALLEANPRGLVPALRQGGWACAESSVILEYHLLLTTYHQLEDTNNTVPLHPTIPKLKANCRLWIDFINTRIVPSFSGVLLATLDEARSQRVEILQRHICELTQAADEKGPYFLGDHMCLVDVHLAPFALRLSRLAPFRGLNPSTLPTRWNGWLDALEQNPHVRSTMSTDALYAQSMDDLVNGFRGVSD